MKPKELKNYFFCIKKNEKCPKSFFGTLACETCAVEGKCEACGRKGTSLCEKCKYGGNENDRSAM